MTEPRYPAIEELRRNPDLPIGDPIRRAAMFEASAREARAESVVEQRAGRDAPAAVFMKQFHEDMEKARAALLKSAQREAENAA